MAKKAASKRPARVSAAPVASPQPEKPKKLCAKPIKWEENKEWFQLAINHLTANEKFRRKLFSDSTSDAQAQNRRKVQASEGKIILYGELAAVVFLSPGIDDEVVEEYKADPARFARSTQQHFARMRKLYQHHRRRFTTTGGGVKEGKDAENLRELINEEWPFYDDLHSLWSELPSYNPIGVTTSNAGQDFAGHAASLWNGDSSGVSSGVEDSTFPDNDLDKESGAEATSDEEKSKKKDSQEKTHNVSQKVKDLKRKLHGDDKKPDVGKKRPNSNVFEGIHEMELKDAAARRAEKNSIRLKELELETQRHELEKERHRAKVRKQELDAKKSDQMMDMMKMFMQQMQPHAGGHHHPHIPSHAHPQDMSFSSSSGGSFFNGPEGSWDSSGNTGTPDLGPSDETKFPNTPEVIGEFTASLYDNSTI